MNTKIFHGDILYATSKDQLVSHEDSYLVVVDGMVEGIYDQIPSAYADAEVIIKDIMTNLSDDADLHSNVRDSSPSAYEAVVDERVDSTIMDGMFNSMMSGDSERAEFFSELSENKPIKMQIRNFVIRKIKDFLLSA